ncbi:MAG: putative peptidoglycan glycosyltransferase FtsW [Chlamydiota bacterium]|nr:putative peptidoglycan glycosyltransferase FtsW [Chlamydiota bacterium]
MNFKNSLIAVVVFILFFVGVIVIFSTSSAEVLEQQLGQSVYSSVLKQIAYAVVGVILGFYLYKLGFSTILQLSPILLAVLTLCLLLTLIPGVGREVNGSKRWLALGFISFQPSEFVKYVIMAFFIYEYTKPFKPGNVLYHFLKTAAKCVVPMILILIEPNNGTVAVIGLSLLVLCLLLDVPIKYWGAPLAIALVVGALFASQLPYVNARIKVYLNPELDIRGKGHQPYQAKIAAGSGGLLGKGPGKSLQKLSYLPEAQNDYIAAIVAEEYGFLGVTGLISLYALLALFGFSIACHSMEPSGFYLASGITFLITFQAFLNMGVVSGLLPSTGLNLPFVSQGGTSLVANIMGVALLLSVGAKSKEAKVINSVT